MRSVQCPETASDPHFFVIRFNVSFHDQAACETGQHVIVPTLKYPVVEEKRRPQQNLHLVKIGMDDTKELWSIESMKSSWAGIVKAPYLETGKYSNYILNHLTGKNCFLRTPFFPLLNYFFVEYPLSPSLVGEISAVLGRWINFAVTSGPRTCLVLLFIKTPNINKFCP